MRNLDEQLYRELKARAALDKKTLGELFNEAIRAYLESTGASARSRSLSATRRAMESGASRKLSRSPEELLRQDRDR